MSLFKRLFNKNTQSNSKNVKVGNSGKMHGITIGTQVWTKTNLDVSLFRNGESIFEARSDAEWKNAGTENKPAWCHYDFNPENGEKYGKLYNSYAVNDARGLAPSGWHIPTEDELKILKKAVNNNGNKLKAVGEGTEAGAGDNTSGFSALLAGRHYTSDTHKDLGSHTNFWSSTESSYAYAMNLILFFKDSSTYITDDEKKYGFSVRCLKD